MRRGMGPELRKIVALGTIPCKIVVNVGLFARVAAAGLTFFLERSGNLFVFAWFVAKA